MMGKDMNVYTFECIRLFFGIMLGMVFFTVFVGKCIFVWEFLIVLAMIYVGSFIPILFLNISNDMDNTAMLEDIKLIYDTLKIQSKAGVFITDILTECYFLVKMPRLKSGVLELANHIYTRHDLKQGLANFNSKFKNVYIDMLVMTLEQSIKSGQTVQMFNDIAQQIQDVEQALYQKEKRRAENKMLAYQLAVYFAILMVVVYAMFSQLLKAFAF